jgi:hypothetical protein
LSIQRSLVYASLRPYSNRRCIRLIVLESISRIGARPDLALAAVRLARLAAARKASIKVRSEAADAFAANVRPIIKEIQASGVSSMRGIARALAARGVKTARGGDWSDV